MGQDIQVVQDDEGQPVLHGLLHVSGLRLPHTVDDIHDELDREASEGLQEGNEDARSNAER